MFCDVLPHLVVLIMTASQSPQQITQNLKQPQHASDLCIPVHISEKHLNRQEEVVNQYSMLVVSLLITSVMLVTS